MIPRRVRTGLLAAAVVLALLPLPSVAIAPALLLMIQQIAGQAASSMLKDTLLSGLSGMGCKGMALANALQALDKRAGAGALMGGMPTMPMNIPPDMAARLGAMLPSAGQLPPGLAMDPDQMAMVSRLQQMMAQPVSPLETVATIDELTELGFLPKPIQTELKECMVLVPATIPALGMGMGMLKPVIPQLRKAREEMRALPPAEQDEVAAALVEQMKSLPADQRAALLEHLDSGFFPPRVSAGVKASLAAR